MRTLLLLLALAACGSSPTTPSTTPVGNAQDEPATTAGPTTIGLVMASQEIWIGNDQHESDPSAQYNGALMSLRAAIEHHPPAAELPAGSLGFVVTFDEKVEVPVPLGPIQNLTAEALGKQVDYRGRIGTEMVAGIARGLDLMTTAHTPRRVLIVLGDGNDTNNEAAKAKLRELRERAEREHIEVRALTMKSALSEPGQVIDVFAPDARTVATAAELDGALAALWQRR